MNETKHETDLKSHTQAELETQLQRIWCQVLQIDTIGRNDNFFELGGHSLQALRVLEQVEATTGRQLVPADLIEAPTLAEFTDVVWNAQVDVPWSPLVAVRTTGDTPPVFCVVPSDGSILNIMDLARELDSSPFFGLEPPLSDKEEPLLFEDLAALYVTAIQSQQPSGPYFMGGRCVGAVIAMEAARQLQAQQQEVSLLFMIDPGPPIAVPNVKTEQDRLSYYKQRFSIHRERGTLRRRLRRHLHNNRLGYALVESDEKAAWAYQEAHFFGRKRYKVKPYHGHVLFFQSDESKKRQNGPLPWLKKGFHLEGDWADFIPDQYDYQLIAGSTNRSILQSPHVELVAEIIRTRMDAAVEAHARSNSAETA
jgi:thioesterase domain-containing protein